MGTNKMHVFLAVPLPEPIQLQISEWSQQIRKLLSFKRWVFPADYHITVKFLGAIDGHTLLKLKSLISEITSEQSTFSLHLEGLNTFGKASSPRILWTEVRGELNPLHIVQKRVDQATHALGFDAENRSYTPHLTLAKNFTLKAGFDTSYLDQAVAYQPPPIQWEVKELVLYQTHLGREPMYESMETFTFGQSIVNDKITSSSFTS